MTHQCTEYRIAGTDTLYCMKIMGHTDDHVFLKKPQDEILMSVDYFTKKYVAPAIEAIVKEDEEKLTKKYKEEIAGWLPKRLIASGEVGRVAGIEVAEVRSKVEFFCPYHKTKFNPRPRFMEGPLNRRYCHYDCPMFGEEIPADPRI